MNNKLFIGNLSWNATEDMLRDAFGVAGTVLSAKIMLDRETKKPRGFAFVEMSSEAEAQRAIDMFNGQPLDGRTIAVNIARPLEDRTPRR